MVHNGAMPSPSPARHAVAADGVLARRHRWLKIGLGIGLPLALLLVWELSVRLGVVDGRFFPPPSRIVISAGVLLADAHERCVLGADLLATGTRILVSYVLGSILGTVTGIAMGLSLPLRYALAPLFGAIHRTPTLALFPLVMVVFGLDDTGKIALMTIGVFFVACVSTLNGAMDGSPVHGDAARAVSSVPARARWTQIKVPGALPAVVTGLKLGLGEALVLAVSTEMVAGQDGIGHFIWDAWLVLDIPRMFVGLVIVALAGGAVVLFGKLLERTLTPWTQ